MMNAYDVIKRPIVTEKSSLLKEKTNSYVFEVAKAADKTTIKSSVEKLFNVKVKAVRTITQRGKVKRFGKSMGQTSAFKKAIVTLVAGNKIELFEGV